MSDKRTGKKAKEAPTAQVIAGPHHYDHHARDDRAVAAFHPQNIEVTENIEVTRKRQNP